MGFRFRKSVSFGPLRVNASKSGLGWSVGVPGARYTKMANGRTRTTASIPGTGVSWVEESKKQPKQTEKSFSWVECVLGVVGVIGLIFLALLENLSKTGGKR